MLLEGLVEGLDVGIYLCVIKSMTARLSPFMIIRFGRRLGKCLAARSTAAAAPAASA